MRSKNNKKAVSFSSFLSPVNTRSIKNVFRDLYTFFQNKDDQKIASRLKRVKVYRYSLLILMFAFIGVSNTSQINAQTGCHVIDWETDCSGGQFPEGFYVTSDAYSCIGVTITNNEALPLVLFNSSAPTGGDLDLGTPSSNCPSCTGSCPGQSNNPNGGLTNCVDQGLILITEENPADTNMDGLEDDPDDHNMTDVLFEFVNPVTISTLDFVDDSQGSITFTFSDMTTSTQVLTGGLDNDVYTQIFNESDVISIQMVLTSSGASSLVSFCYDDPGSPPCDLVAPVLGADVDICNGDDPGPIEILSGATGTGNIMYQWQQSLTGCNGFGDILGATDSVYNPTVLFQSTYFRVVISTNDGMQICTEPSNCISYTEISCPNCVNPVVTAEAISPTCSGGVAQSNGYLELTTISVGDAYHWSIGNTFNNNGGANTYANGVDITTATFPVQVAPGQPNPSGTQDYTIRVYNGANDCFTDVVVTMVEKVCTDYGDLQDTSAGTGTGDYQTLAANAGPSHEIITGLSIGASVDDDLDGQSSVNANGDSDDGFSFSSTFDIVPGGTLNIPIDVVNTTGNTAHYEVWIDWNNDGDFNDPNEMVANLSDNGSGNFGQSTFPVTVPSGAVTDQPLGFRARLSNTDNMSPNGAVTSGEVEDYLITISCKMPICLPVTVIKS